MTAGNLFLEPIFPAGLGLVVAILRIVVERHCIRGRAANAFELASASDDARGAVVAALQRTGWRRLRMRVARVVEKDFLIVFQDPLPVAPRWPLAVGIVGEAA